MVLGAGHPQLASEVRQEAGPAETALLDLLRQENWSDTTSASSRTAAR